MIYYNINEGFIHLQQNTLVKRQPEIYLPCRCGTPCCHLLWKNVYTWIRIFRHFHQIERKASAWNLLPFRYYSHCCHFTMGNVNIRFFFFNKTIANLFLLLNKASCITKRTYRKISKTDEFYHNNSYGLYWYLTHLCRVDSSILTLWTDPFPVKRVSG